MSSTSSTDGCVNCGSQEHTLASCPSHLDQGGFTQPRPSSATELRTRAFQYTPIPLIPNIYNYPTAALLTEDLHRWGVSIEYWARGMQSYAIQLREVVTRIHASPHFFINAQGFSMEMQLPTTLEAQAAVDNAVYHANVIVEHTHPGHRFELFSPLSPPSTARSIQPVYSEPAASQVADAQDTTPSSAPAPTPPASHEQTEVPTPSPAPGGRGRTRSAGNRGGAVARGRVTKPRNVISTPNFPGGPRKRASRKKVSDEVTQEEATAGLAVGGDGPVASLKARKGSNARLGAKKVGGVKEEASSFTEKSADPFDAMLAAQLAQHAGGDVDADAEADAAIYAV